MLFCVAKTQLALALWKSAYFWIIWKINQNVCFMWWAKQVKKKGEKCEWKRSKWKKETSEWKERDEINILQIESSIGKSSFKLVSFYIIFFRSMSLFTLSNFGFDWYMGVCKARRVKLGYLVWTWHSTSFYLILVLIMKLWCSVGDIFWIKKDMIKTCFCSLCLWHSITLSICAPLSYVIYSS